MEFFADFNVTQIFARYMADIGESEAVAFPGFAGAWKAAFGICIQLSPVAVSYFYDIHILPVGGDKGNMRFVFLKVLPLDRFDGV